MDKKEYIVCPTCGHDVFLLAKKSIGLVHIYKESYVHKYNKLAKIDEEIELLHCNNCSAEMDFGREGDGGET